MPKFCRKNPEKPAKFPKSFKKKIKTTKPKGNHGSLIKPN